MSPEKAAYHCRCQILDWFQTGLKGGVLWKALGDYEAKTHLAQLLDRVARGERITIMKHGVPVAVLQPTDSVRKTPLGEAIDELKRFRHGRRLMELTIKEMVEEGRS